jgi:hypothetical protein
MLTMSVWGFYLFGFTRTYNVFQKFWRGQYSLSISFWGFYVFGWLFGFAGFLVAVVIPLELLGLRLAVRFLSLGFIVYPLWAGVGVWRSGGSGKSSRTWRLLARGIVGFYTLGILYHAINGGALRVIRVLIAG